MHFLALALSLGAARLIAAQPIDCHIAIECSNGNVYVGCDAVAQCEAAGGHLPPVPETRSAEPQVTCALIVFCSNGVTYRGCSAVQQCTAAGGVSCGGAGCSAS